MKERHKKENRKKQTKAEKNKVVGGGAEAIVGGWEQNDFVVHLS